MLQAKTQRSAATVAAVVAMLGYVALWAGYHRGWWSGVDSSSLNVLHDFAIKHPSWVRFWEVVCEVFSPRGFRILAAITIVVVLIQRNLRAALFLILTVELSGVVIQGAKGLADRPRPVTALAPVTSTSFPSGHALGAMVGVLALLVVLLPMMNTTMQTVLVAAGVLIVLAVGFGRVALNVHHPSDVLAGWALGYAYVVLWAQLLRLPPPLRR